ncbi:MAG: HTH domain-containing protein [Planctomycetia bacterium]|nr:HTH domain-containing protein [Planctomycetia bacterium]
MKTTLSKMTQHRTRRYLKLLNLLMSGYGYTTDELSRKCNVSKRTVYRDLQLLSDVGVPLHHDPKSGGHTIAQRRCASPNPSLTAGEINALLLAAYTSSFRSLESLGQLADQAISKMLITLPRQQRQEIISSLKSCAVELSLHEGQQHILTSLLSAVCRRQQTRIAFIPDASGRPPLHTKISPYRLIAASDGWKVVGRSSLHRGVRCFEVSQIHSVEITEDTFSLPQKFLRHHGASNVLFSRGHVKRSQEGLASLLAMSSESSASDQKEDDSSH